MTTVTLELDDDVVRALEAEAARSGRPSHEIVSAAVRLYVQDDIFTVLRERSAGALSEEEGMQLALDEIRAMREERDKAQ
jgi:predicted transcriptional regulator